MLQISDDVKQVIAILFRSGWRIATAFRIPGTNINIPEFCLACLVLVFVLRVVPHILGISLPAPNHAPEGNSSNAVNEGNLTRVHGNIASSSHPNSSRGNSRNSM